MTVYLGIVNLSFLFAQRAAGRSILEEVVRMRCCLFWGPGRHERLAARSAGLLGALLVSGHPAGCRSLPALHGVLADLPAVGLVEVQETLRLCSRTAFLGKIRLDLFQTRRRKPFRCSGGWRRGSVYLYRLYRVCVLCTLYFVLWFLWVSLGSPWVSMGSPWVSMGFSENPSVSFAFLGLPPFRPF